MPQANWSVIENGITDWEEFKLTFVDLDLLQEGWASSKKPLHHGLKHSTSQNPRGEEPAWKMFQEGIKWDLLS